MIASKSFGTLLGCDDVNESSTIGAAFADPSKVFRGPLAHVQGWVDRQQVGDRATQRKTWKID